MRAVLFVCFVSLFASCIFAQQTITFNPAEEANCLSTNGGCSFFNSTIWINGSVPTLADSVIISGSSADSDLLIYVPPFTIANVSLVSVSNSTFTIFTNGVLDIQGELVLGDNAAFVTQNGSTFTTTNISMSYHGDATQSWDISGQVTADGVVHLLGDFNVEESGSVVFNYVYYYPSSVSGKGSAVFNTISVPHYATVALPSTFGASSVILNSNSTATFTLPSFNVQQLYLDIYSSIQFTNTNVTLGPSVNGSQTLGGSNSSLVLRNSKLVILGIEPSTFNGEIDASFSTVYARNVTISKLSITLGYENQLVGDGLELGYTTVFGNVSSIGAGINFTDYVTIYGSLTVENKLYISNDAIVSVTDNVTFGANSTVVLGGHLFTNPNPLVIPEGVSIICTIGNSSTDGDVVLHGNIYASTEDNLIIGGGLTISATSLLDVTVSSEFYSPITAFDGIQINGGKVVYSIAKHRMKSQSYLVLGTLFNQVITGTFSGTTASAGSDSAVKEDLPLRITTTDVFVDYKVNLKDVPYWVWIIVGGGVAAIIIVIVVVCCMRRRRNDYSPVR